jgi:cell division protein FtsZ
MIKFSVEEDKQRRTGASLKVLGVGGGGGNAVNSMMAGDDLSIVDFIVANTDEQALGLSTAQTKVQLGSKITKGLGAGSNPDMGRRAAEEDLELMIKHIADSDMLFLTAGLGGGTGSGALPIIAEAAREAGVLSVAVVTKPFAFEGRVRMRNAEEAINALNGVVDTLIVVPNNKLLELADPKISMLDAFALSNDILKQAVKGISDIIAKPGHINVDFADVRSVMKGMGMALMGTGRCSGEDRAKEAALEAINSPLLENVSIHGAKGVLINIAGGANLGLHEINEAATVVYDLVSEDANIILGSVVDESMGDEVSVTVIATGFHGAQGSVDVSDRQIIAAAAYAASRKELEKKEAPVLEASSDKETEDELIVDKTFDPTEVADFSSASFDLNDIDTPTFLRRKAEREKEL